MRLYNSMFLIPIAALCALPSYCLAYANPVKSGISIQQVSGPVGLISENSMTFSAINSTSVPPILLNGPATPGSRPIDFGKGPFAAGNYPVVKVTWNPKSASQSANGYVLAVRMMGAADGQAAANTSQVVAAPPANCPGLDSNCLIPYPTVQVRSSADESVNSYYASYSIAPGATIRLSLDFRAMCDSYAAMTGNIGTGCSNLISPVPYATGDAGQTKIFLRFDIVQAPSVLPTMEPVLSGSETLVDSSGLIAVNLSSSSSVGLPSASASANPAVSENGKKVLPMSAIAALESISPSSAGLVR